MEHWSIKETESLKILSTLTCTSKQGHDLLLVRSVMGTEYLHCHWTYHFKLLHLHQHINIYHHIS